MKQKTYENDASKSYIN